MGERDLPAKLSIYVPQKQAAQHAVERLIRLGRQRSRSVNCLVVEAILEYLDREEKRQ
ncbi:MAG: hypothetical protein PHU43_04075 [Candidatus Bipolaricaulis sp.]|nr:hypothetical protein [Candidatus Bipolaricaulis sp.]